jgi:L-threonylcarbamoyladenylate synthase
VGALPTTYVTPTDLLEIDQHEPAPEAIARAADLIRKGGIVAIPTDALYTLIADPFNLRAVRGVFSAKGRESLYSLPLLVSDFMMAEELVTDPPVRFTLLTRRFWPGPLTIIVPASAKVPLRVTGNTGRLGLRQSRSKVAEALLETLGQPLVATSANVTGAPTCASGIEVFGVLDGRIDLVLDGGHCSGMGATTIDITEPYWRLIKEGAVPERDIAECLKGA